MALAPSQRRRLRHALSDAFVDTLLEPEDIARRIKGVDPALLERLFFEEVAPVCHGNLLSPAPAVWTAFDEAWLEEAIERRLARQRSSALRRWHERCLVAWLRWRYADTWRAIAGALERAPQRNTEWMSLPAFFVSTACWRTGGSGSRLSLSASFICATQASTRSRLTAP